MIIPEDMEPDEQYTPAPIHQPSPAPTPMHPMPPTVLKEYGQARSALTQQLEQRLQTINTEVNRLFASAYESEIKALEQRVTLALSRLGPDSPQTAPQKAEMLKAAVSEHENITRKYNHEGRRQYDAYIGKKRRLDLDLYKQAAQQTTTAGLRTLLETYCRHTNNLLDAYVADIKAVLKL